MSGFLKYIATRKGVEKYTNDQKLLPVTKNQKDLVEKIIKMYPDSKTLFEYEDYMKSRTRDNASEFITSSLEHYCLGGKNSNPEIYAKYIATRPNSEKITTHGLFGQTDNISLQSAMDELKNHKGNVWTHIVSLKREDADRLGYNDVNSWKNLVRSQSMELAKQMKIQPQDLVWYGAFHNESHHPHIHLMAYSKKENNGYLTKHGINNLRSSFGREIFKQDLIQVYEKQTVARDNLKEELLKAISNLENEPVDKMIEQEPLKSKFLGLSKSMEQYKGRKFYGYLPKVIKSQVDEILNLFSELEPIKNCFELWDEQRKEVLKTYQDKEVESTLKLSDIKEFHHLKNIIIKTAVEINSPVPPKLNEKMEQGDYTDLEISFKDYLGVNALISEVKEDLKTGSTVTEEVKNKIDKLEKLADERNQSASFFIGNLYSKGEFVPQNHTKAFYLLQKYADKNMYFAYSLGQLMLHSEEEKIIDMGRNMGVFYLEESCDMGNKNTWNSLGYEYLKGENVPQNIERAIHYFNLSAKENNSYAMFQLGKIYLYGIGTDKNKELGMEYLRKAIMLGNPIAKDLVIHLSSDPLEMSYRAIVSNLTEVFKTPYDPHINVKKPIVDQKIRSKMKRKALAHGQKDSGIEVKG